MGASLEAVAVGTPGTATRSSNAGRQLLVERQLRRTAIAAGVREARATSGIIGPREPTNDTLLASLGRRFGLLWLAAAGGGS